MNCRTHPELWEELLELSHPEYGDFDSPRLKQLGEFFCGKRHKRYYAPLKGLKCKPVTVIEPDGHVEYFRSINQCSEHYGIATSSVKVRLEGRTLLRNTKKNINFNEYTVIKGIVRQEEEEE